MYLFWQVSAVVLCITDMRNAAGDLVVRPENTAGIIGSHAVLKCQGSNPLDPERYSWFDVMPNGDDDPISEDDTVYEEYSQYYSVFGNHEVYEYNLNISLHTSTSGPRRCNQFRPADNAAAYVIVVVSDPVCNSSIPPGNVTTEDEINKHTCEIRFDSIHPVDWRPVITWSSDDATLTPVDESSSETLKTTVEAKATVQVFAKMHFEYNGTLTDTYAKNAPTYSWSFVSESPEIVPSRGLSRSAIIGIAVGCSLFFVLIVGGVAFFVIKYKTTKKSVESANEKKVLKNSS